MFDLDDKLLDEFANLDITDLMPDIDEGVKDQVNRIGTKTRVLLSSGILPVSILLTLTQFIIHSAKKNDKIRLNEIEEHLDLGLGIAIINFPFSGCQNCGSLEKCSEVMKDVKEITPEEASDMMANMMPTIGTA